jgi:hypothetical protein
MKVCFKPWLAFLFICFIFSGCDLLDKADDVTFDVVIEVDWTADENEDGANVPFAYSEEVDLNDNAEVAKYANKIKEIKITKITYAVTNYNAEPHNTAVFFNNGVASFTATGANSAAVSIPYAASATGVNLQATTSETELDIDEAELNKLAAIFKDDKMLELKSEGILSVTPVSFNVVSKFYLTITANALD